MGVELSIEIFLNVLTSKKFTTCSLINLAQLDMSVGLYRLTDIDLDPGYVTSLDLIFGIDAT